MKRNEREVIPRATSDLSCYPEAGLSSIGVFRGDDRL
jgi:hypothetical protein